MLDQRVDGRLVTLTPKGQSVQIVCRLRRRLFASIVKRSALRLGAGTVVVTAKGADRSLTALRVYVGQGGVMPPF